MQSPTTDAMKCAPVLKAQKNKRSENKREVEPTLLLPPWQPLSEHLTPSEYSKMLLDHKKYALYRLAIVSAIGALSRAGTNVSVIGVVGAGYGGLVQCVLDATPETKVQTSVFAMDKNPVAVNELRRRKLTEPAWEQVDILDMDMRDDEFVSLYLGRVDIIVSELLGGFGDNELAPECLIACKKLLSPTGVSIPSSTTSYLAPVHARDLRRVMLNSGNPTDRERWWVHYQHLSRITDVVLLAQPLPVFSFVYPDKKGTLYRNRCLQFRCESAGDRLGKSESWCHGFMGYFEAALHGKVWLSTLPDRATKDLLEWNPVFFPAKHTFNLPAQVNMCRASCSKGERIWYSWSVVSDETPDGDEHNFNGRHCYMSCKLNKDGPATCE